MKAKREAPLTGGAANSAKVIHTTENDSRKAAEMQEKLSRLYVWLENEGVSILDFPFRNSKMKGVLLHLPEDDVYGVALNYSLLKDPEEEYRVLLHEVGHYVTGSLYKVGAPLEERKRCEAIANAWAEVHA